MSLMFEPLRKYFDFKGRSRRAEYWQFWLFQMLVGLGTIALSSLAAPIALVMAIGACLFSLACIVPNLSVAVRRLHDTGRSGWWYLLVIPGLFFGSYVAQLIIVFFGSMIYGAYSNSLGFTPGILPKPTVLQLVGGAANLTLFVFMVLPGSKGENRFGPDPKGDGTSDIARIFDAPEPEDARPAYAEPHKPVFDFGPSRGVPTVRETAPAPAPQPRYTPAPAGNPLAPGAVRPTFGKRR